MGQIDEIMLRRDDGFCFSSASRLDPGFISAESS